MSSTDNKVATLKSDNKNNPANDPKLIKLPMSVLDYSWFLEYSCAFHKR
jgi:hypothetical protein